MPQKAKIRARAAELRAMFEEVGANKIYHLTNDKPPTWQEVQELIVNIVGKRAFEAVTSENDRPVKFFYHPFRPWLSSLIRIF